MPMNINKAVDKAFEGKTLKELAESPVHALSGVTERDAEYLKKAFKVKTIKDLAKLKVVLRAQAIVNLAETEL
jgi:hypothetical protein